MRRTSVDGAADALCGSKDLLDGAAQFAGHRARTHRSGNREHIVEGDVAVVLDWMGVTNKYINKLLANI